MANVANVLMGKSPNLRKITIIRHGATALNGDRGKGERIRGWKDVPLSEEGKEEVKKTAKSLKNSGINVLLHSDLSRAADTAAAVAEQTGAKMVPTQKLRPWDLGHYAGQESTKVHPIMKEYAEKMPDKPVPGGESFNSFKARTFQGLREAMMTPGDVGIVTHHRVERLIKAWQKAGEPANGDIDLKEFFKFGDPTGHAEPVYIQPQKLGIVPQDVKPNLVRQLLGNTK